MSSKEDAVALLKDTSYFYDASDKLLEALSGKSLELVDLTAS